MELNEKWKEQAATFEDNLPYPFDGGTFGEYKSYDFGFERGFIKGAQTYADAVEKMLKKEIAERTQAMSKLSNRVAIRAQITTLNKLLEELKSIQP